MLTINSNLLALNAKNNFNIMNAKKIKSSEKLSSGYRINRSADDAAGLAISESEVWTKGLQMQRTAFHGVRPATELWTRLMIFYTGCPS